LPWDYDGRWLPDIFISGMAKCVLYQNNRNGTFTDVTETSGIAASQWSNQCRVVRFMNGDGKVRFIYWGVCRLFHDRICGVSESYGGAEKGAVQGQSFYCVPSVLKPMPSHVYRNLGGGKFPTSARVRGFLPVGAGLGRGAADINGDGYPDLFVSNDLAPNFLWVTGKERASRKRD